MNAPTTTAETFSGQHPPTAECRTVAPPATLRRFQVRKEDDTARWAAYDVHPAYTQFADTATARERSRALLRFLHYFLIIALKRTISYELVPAHLRKPKGIPGTLRFLRAGLHNAVAKLAFGKPPHGTHADCRVMASLREDGICVVAPPAAAFERIRIAAEPLFGELREARGILDKGERKFEESRGSAHRTVHRALYDAVESMLEQNGILDACSQYLGYPAMLVDINPQVNDPTDNFWERIFPDLPAAPRPMAYLHRDASGGDIKAIIYMSDVGPDNGPFHYTIGSHRLRGGRLVDWIEETNDQSGFSTTHPDLRLQFAALPRSLQRKCAFGNDILHGSEIADRLAASEWVIEAGRGHLVLFDTKGFHRGGMVRHGERVVLTCVIGTNRR